MTASTVVPRQPSNAHVIQQADAWGWRVQGARRGKTRLRHVITNDHIDVEPAGGDKVHGNRSAVLQRLYELTGVNAEGFWQGPDRVAIENINKAQRRRDQDRLARTPGPRRDAPVTTSVGDVLADAAAKAATEQTKTTKETAVQPIVKPSAQSNRTDDPDAIVTPRDDAGRDAILKASELPGGATMINQAFTVLAKYGMPMTTDDVHKQLSHLTREQVQGALSNMGGSGVITRLQRGLYQTKAAPVTDRSRLDVISPDDHHVELVPHREEAKETRAPAMATLPPAPTEPTVPAPTPAPPVAESPVMAPLADEDLDELFDLLFPDGVTIRARHIAVITEWKAATTKMVNELMKDN